MSNPTIPLPHGYHLEEIDYHEGMTYAFKHIDIPFSDTVSFDVELHQSPEDAEKKQRFMRNPALFTLFYLVKKDDEVVGWHSSYQTLFDTLYMQLTGIYPDHQGKGLYKAILKIVMERAKQEGFSILTSKHHVVNNAVLVPKLKAGFTIHSFAVNRHYGLMVHLNYYLKDHDRQLNEFRAGHRKLPTELRPYIALWDDDMPPQGV